MNRKDQLKTKKMNFLALNRLNRKGQLKIQQMAFVLIAVTLFFVLIGMFVLVFQFSGLQESAEILEQENAILLTSKIAESPEFSCGQAYQRTRVNCIDLDKVRALEQNMDTYSGFWGIEGIEIRKIYPEEENIEILSSGGEGVGVSNFVALCQKANTNEDEIYNKCELGKIIITYQS